jgi:polysaccharide biosynthesis protein PelF
MVDVCLIIEGAYPFVSGGVSSWLHALISNLPQFTFAVVHLSDKPDPDRKPKYKLPANVVEFQEVYLHDPNNLDAHRRKSLDDTQWQALNDFHHSLRADTQSDDPDFLTWLGRKDHRGITNHDFLYSQKGWELLTELYSQFAPDKSFVDYFWTFRITHIPLFALLEAKLPDARIYHPISVGFGGFLGALAKLRTGRPLILTEHGIYLREREIEIAQIEWIYVEKQQDFQLGRRMDFFQQWWLNMFRYMTRLTYDMADKLVTITRVNTRYQLRYGADPEKILVIPNGIDTSKLGKLQKSKGDLADKFVVGFVGRVVSIKDIKTFIRSIKIASASIPNIYAYIIGPTDEEPEYFEECQQLVKLLNIGSYIEFTGQAKIDQYFPLLDVMVLTSLSEGQPLVILEGNCAGIPVIATDVGACRELLTGTTSEDIALGPSGLITLVDSPSETAEALILLARDPELRQRMSDAGRKRVMRYYRQETLYEAYSTLYHHYCHTNITDMAPQAIGLPIN